MSKNDGLSLTGSQILPKPRSKNLKGDPRVSVLGKLRPNSARHDRINSSRKSSDASLRPKSADNVLLYREKRKQRLSEETRVRCLEKPEEVSKSGDLTYQKIEDNGESIDVHVESSRLTNSGLIHNASKPVRTNSPNMKYVHQSNSPKESENSLRGIRTSSYLQKLKESVWTSIIEDGDKNSFVNAEDMDKNTAEYESDVNGHRMEDHEKSKLDEVLMQLLSKDEKDGIQFGSVLTGFSKEEEISITTPLVSNVEKTLVSLLAELENEVTFQSNVQNAAAEGSGRGSGTSLSPQGKSSPLSQAGEEIQIREECSSSQSSYENIPYETYDHPPDDSKEMQNEVKDEGRFPKSRLKPIAEDALLSSPSKEVERVLKASKETLQQGIVEILNIEKGTFQYSTEDGNTHHVSIGGRPTRPTTCIGESPVTWTEFAGTEDDDAESPELFDSSSKSFLETVSIYMEEEYKKSKEQCKENEKSILDKENIGVIGSARKFEKENNLLEEICGKNNNVDVEMDVDSLNLSDEDSMYEDVVSALKILEKEENEAVNLSSRPPPTGSESGNTPRVKATDILSFLDTVDETCETNIETVPNGFKLGESKSDHVTHTSKESRDVSDKSASSNNILEMRLQEQAKGLSLMKKELKDTRKRLQKEKEDLRKNLTEENEKVVQRHQEFIQKLLAEKQGLADKCETLTATIKQTEENHKRNIKAMEEQHAISIRNERERIRLEQRATRDKWMREKTQKIQVVTAKGAEGEVKRLVSEQVYQIEALWRARLDELRGRLEREAEEGMAKERETARKRLEERVEEMERFHQEERRKFLSEECVLRGRAEEAERKVREIDEEARRRRADDLEAERMRFQAKLEKVTEEMENHHQISLSKERAQREIAVDTARKEERELMEADHRKQEARMKDRFRAERDQAIEKAVAHLTAQTEKVQLDAESRAEMSLRRMRERCDEQVRSAEEEAEKQRKQCADLRSQSAIFQEEKSILKITVTRLEKELEAAHKMNNTLYEERSQIRDLVVEEWSARVAALREEVGILKAQITAEKDRKAIELVQVQRERGLELIQIQKRVEVALAKKEEAYNQLKAKYEGALHKCSQLQELLEKQRMDLLLK